MALAPVAVDGLTRDSNPRLLLITSVAIAIVPPLSTSGLTRIGCPLGICCFPTTLRGNLLATPDGSGQSLAHAARHHGADCGDWLGVSLAPTRTLGSSGDGFDQRHDGSSSGQVSDAPIQWIYYHLTHSSGRQLSCVFTMSAEELERFGGEDLAIAESILFLDSTHAAEATADAASDAPPELR